MDTIFAQATASGRAGLSVVRISGPCALDACRLLTGDVPTARTARLRKIRSSAGEHIDDAVIVTFETPQSFTGEDVVELHLHGSTAIIQRVLIELGSLDGLRLADPGEFTRRALENGKMDLTQVEGLGDLIEAETESQRKQALRVLDGEFGKKVDSWRSSLIKAASLLEATIDFADEEVPVDVTPEVSTLLNEVKDGLRREIAGAAVAERIRTGFEVAIVGLPNVGKSTLLNRIAGREAAITSSIAGTTRDVLEVRMDLHGLAVTFLDTAGLRDGADEIERIGIERAVQRAQSADFRVFLTHPGDELPFAPKADDIVVKPKADLMKSDGASVSGLTGQGIDELLEEIANRLSARTSSAGLATHARHTVAMGSAYDNIVAAIQLVEQGPEHYDLAAAELGFGIRSLAVLVGRIDVESLLEEIFMNFCVGK